MQGASKAWSQGLRSPREWRVPSDIRSFCFDPKQILKIAINRYARKKFKKNRSPLTSNELLNWCKIKNYQTTNIIMFSHKNTVIMMRTSKLSLCVELRSEWKQRLNPPNSFVVTCHYGNLAPRGWRGCLRWCHKEKILSIGAGVQSRRPKVQWQFKGIWSGRGRGRPDGIKQTNCLLWLTD